MKATGIVRRVDDLGRVVIPREIRRSMGIEEGEPLEIFVDDNKVIFQKFQKSIDWEKAWVMVNSVMPKNVLCAVYDPNGKRQAGNMFFPNTLNEALQSKDCYRCDDSNGRLIGFVVVDSDEIDDELVIKVLRAFIED